MNSIAQEQSIQQQNRNHENKKGIVPHGATARSCLGQICRLVVLIFEVSASYRLWRNGFIRSLDKETVLGLSRDAPGIRNEILLFDFSDALSLSLQKGLEIQCLSCSLFYPQSLSLSLSYFSFS